MSINELSAEEAQQRKAKIAEAGELGILVDDAVLVFRKIVDRMPTTTWLLDAKGLVEAASVPERNAARKADVQEELDELHRDLRALALDWVTGWYARGGIFVARDGSIEGFRYYVETLAPELATLKLGGTEEIVPPEVLERIREAIRPCAPQVVIEMLKCANLVVSDAMRYALLG